MEKHKAAAHKEKYSRPNHQSTLCRGLTSGSDIKVLDYVRRESIENNAKSIALDPKDLFKMNQILL